jgi:phage terminase Nu1 subunit (DNA packaging protein)
LRWLKDSRGLTVGRRQCVDVVGWTPNDFDKAVREGMPVAERPSGRGTDYVVFMGDVIRWIVEQELKAAGHDPSEVKKLDLNEERARLAKEQADKLDLENKLARGELLRAEDVLKADEVVFAGLRDRIMAVQSVVPMLCDAALKDGERAMRPILREALTSALEDVGTAELVEGPVQGAGEPVSSQVQATLAA